jgi:hypothetical protein
LAIVVVAILHQGFDGLVVDDAFDIGQRYYATEWLKCNTATQ